MYDFYKSTKHPAERIATRQGAGLPGHVAARDWKMTPAGASQFIADLEEEIGAHGFYYFTLC